MERLGARGPGAAGRQPAAVDCGAERVGGRVGLEQAAGREVHDVGGVRVGDVAGGNQAVESEPAPRNGGRRRELDVLGGCRRGRQGRAVVAGEARLGEAAHAEAGNVRGEVGAVHRAPAAKDPVDQAGVGLAIGDQDPLAAAERAVAAEVHGAVGGLEAREREHRGVHAGAALEELDVGDAAGERRGPEGLGGDRLLAA